MNRRRRRQIKRGIKGKPDLRAKLYQLVWLWQGWGLLALLAVHTGYWFSGGVLLLIAVLTFVTAPSPQRAMRGLDHEFGIDSEDFIATIAGATDKVFSDTDSVEILSNGDEFYPAMLEEIHKAEHTITMEVYIYWGGEIGTKFATVLADKARAGIQVKLLLDAIGSLRISDEIIDILQAGGCQLAWFHPLHWYALRRVNNRTHRKSLIIDGRVGFTGGAGIDDRWTGNAENPDHWRDTQVRVRGQAAKTLQTGFASNWAQTTHEIISGPGYYPLQDCSGSLKVLSILGSPRGGISTVRSMYYLSLICARKSLYIASPYFVPDRVAIDCLIAARRRGVDIKIITPGRHNDSRLARQNSIRVFGRLLKCGIELYDYNHTMLHHKIMIADGLWATVGTSNFDLRSFALNEENNVCVYDRQFAEKLERDFFGDLARSERVELKAWKKRSWLTKLAGMGAAFMRPQV